jgi:hypothetical protein
MGFQLAGRDPDSRLATAIAASNSHALNGLIRGLLQVCDTSDCHDQKASQVKFQKDGI